MQRNVVAAICATLLVAQVGFARGRTETPTSTTTTTTAQPASERYYQADESIAYMTTEIVDDFEYSYNAMARYGCFFMSCLGVAQTHAQKTLSSQQINTIRASALSSELISSDMTTNAPAAVIDLAFSVLGSRLHVAELRRVKTLESLEPIYPSTIVYGTTFNSNPHFYEGNDEGICVYNPSPTSYLRTIKGYIVIRISGYRLLDPLRSLSGPRGTP